jgi:CBS domain containing-hemolysin-like protein
MPNSPDPLPSENEDDDYTTTPDTETNADYRARTHTLIRELRRIYGLHFAPGYEDTDTLGHLLVKSGLNTLEEYLQRHHIT